MTKILLVEDDSLIREPLALQLEKFGFSVKFCASLTEARAVDIRKFELIILDWELPDGEGLDFLRELRMSGHKLPVIFLTARTDLSDKVAGLELGANDYLTKPFEPRELVARIRSQLRQNVVPLQKNKLAIGAIAMDLESHRVTFKGQPIELSKMEFALLKYFMENPEKALGRDEILDNVWGIDNYPNTRTVDAHVVFLRQKFEPDFFETLRGIGYRFKVPA